MSNHELRTSVASFVPNKFIGKGIVCGLEVCADQNCLVVVNGGYGFTNGGALIEITQPAVVFGYYRPYINKEEYPLFLTKKNPPVRNRVWELLENPAEDAKPLTPQTEEELENLFLLDKVAILFLEKGEDAYVQKYLLMERSSLLSFLGLTGKVDQLLGQKELDDDFIYSEDYSLEDDLPDAADIFKAESKVFDLLQISIPRFGFAKNDPYDCPPESENDCALSKLNSLDDLYQAYLPIGDQLSEALDKELRKLFHNYAPLVLDFPQPETIKWLDLLCEKWVAFKNLNESIKIGEPKKEYVQYFHDWMRDLTQAYHELRKELFDLQIFCNEYSWQEERHLLLGLVMRSTKLYQASPLRSNFIQPPVFNGEALRLQKVKLYFHRLLMMIRGFHLPDNIFDKNTGKYCPVDPEEIEEVPSINKVKITPGLCCGTLLEKQTIPFYYPLSFSKYSVHHYWNFNHSRMGTENRLMSYHANATEDSYSQIPEITRPLCYDLCAFDCFRIEGHIGKDINKDKQQVFIGEEFYEIEGVVNQLDFFIKKYNLDFKVKVVSFSVSEQMYLSGEPISAWKYSDQLIGMEHSGMVKRGGTFILVTDIENGKIIADFSLPYLCCDDLFEPSENKSAAEKASKPLAAPLLKEKEKEESSTTEKLKNQTKDQPNEKKEGMQIEKSAAEKEVKTEVKKIVTASSEKGKDDLTKIKGIGAVFQQKLNSLGFYRYEQLRELDHNKIMILNAQLGIAKKGSIKIDFAKEAKKLMKK